MELLKVVSEINKRILLLEAGRKLLQERAEKKAHKSALYDKEVALTTLKLKSSKYEPFMSDYGLSEKDLPMPVTLIDKVTKGICWKHKLEADLAESEWKVALIGLDTLQSELSALQSIYKHLEEV